MPDLLVLLGFSTLCGAPNLKVTLTPWTSTENASFRLPILAARSTSRQSRSSSRRARFDQSPAGLPLRLAAAGLLDILSFFHGLCFSRGALHHALHVPHQGTRSPALQGWSRGPAQLVRSALGCLSVVRNACTNEYVRFLFRRPPKKCKVVAARRRTKLVSGATPCPVSRLLRGLRPTCLTRSTVCPRIVDSADSYCAAPSAAPRAPLSRWDPDGLAPLHLQLKSGVCCLWCGVCDFAYDVTCSGICCHADGRDPYLYVFARERTIQQSFGGSWDQHREVTHTVRFALGR